MMDEKHCCSKMYTESKEGTEKELKDHSVRQYKRWRQSFVYFRSETDSRKEEEFTSLTEIQYCPFCGNKFPKELSDEWWDILENGYKIDSPIHDDRDKVPPEFWTDEWWKKRGL